jgi:myo-inositol-1(or 4)-monophosphatase
MAEIALVELEDFAFMLAHTAGGIAHAHFRQPITVENKSANAFDPVTNADRAIERVLRTAIDARYPDHGIVAEEEGERAGAGEYTWFIDPIDGTRAFMTGSRASCRNSRAARTWFSLPPSSAPKPATASPTF